MTQLTYNIYRHEVVCKCGECGFDTLDIVTANVVQKCVNHIKEWTEADRVIVHVTSGCRCKKHNTEVTKDPESKSQHLYGRALDFWVEIAKDGVLTKIDPALVYERLSRRYRGMYGIGKYEDFTHFDSRTNGPARWDMT